MARRLKHRLAFVGIHKHCSGQQIRFVFWGNRQKSVLIRVDQLTGLDGGAKHFYGAIPANGDDMRMPHAQAARQGFETGIGHLIEVTDGTICDGTYTTQRPVYVAIDFAPK